METKELFLEYHELKKEYLKAKQEYDKVLDKKAQYLYSVLPGSPKIDLEMVKGSTSDKLLNYTIKTAEIDKEIEVRRNLMDHLLYKLKIKAIELRNSKTTLDKIYVYHYEDHVSVRKFCKLLNYSKSQIYRKIDEIQEKIQKNAKMGQNGTNLVLQW